MEIEIPLYQCLNSLIKDNILLYTGTCVHNEKANSIYELFEKDVCTQYSWFGVIKGVCIKLYPNVA
ncbi:MAG: hypothetical protein AMK69_24080 [Nitrospira bacterium SG8_3]|nr:MAG: hypothetical protein AMK69_24080 [Nitrospira bacterium SG8_3]